MKKEILEELLWAVIVFSLITIGVCLFFNKIIEVTESHYFTEHPSFNRPEDFPWRISEYEKSELYGYTNQGRWVE